MKIFVNDKIKKISNAMVLTAPYQKKDVANYAIITDADISKIRIVFDIVVENVVIRPQRYGIEYKVIDEHTVELYPEKRYNFSVEPDGKIENSVQIFCGMTPEVERVQYENVICFEEGEHFADTILVDRDNTLVYLKEGAVVHGRVKFLNCKNVALDGFGELTYEAYTHRRRLVDVDGCSDVEIRNITMKSSTNWNTRILGCDRVHIDNIKIIGYRGNSDGVDVCSSRDVLVENIFTRVWDDSLVVKGFERGDVYNVTFKNCVLWNDFARPMEVGVEIRADKMYNIRFLDIDLIHSVTGYPIMGIHHGDRAEIYNIYFENINIEHTPGAQLLDLRVIPSAWNSDDKMGRVHNVYFKNINVLSDPNAEILPYHSRIQGYSDVNNNSDVYFENIRIFGKAARNTEELGLQVFDYVDNIVVSASEGPFIERVKTDIKVMDYSLRDHGNYNVNVMVTLENTTDTEKRGTAMLKLSPAWKSEYDKDIEYSIGAHSVAEFVKTIKLPAGKYAFSLDSSNSDLECAVEFLNLELLLTDKFEDCPAYYFRDSYGNSFDDEVRLALKGDLLMIKTELMKKYDITLHAAKPVGEPKVGDILFSIEDTNIGKAPAILLGKNGECLEGPQIGCPEEIGFVFKNYPKVDIKTITLMRQLSSTAILPMSEIDIEDAQGGFLLELVLQAKPEKRYDFTLFASPINKTTKREPKVMAHMFVMVKGNN